MPKNEVLRFKGDKTQQSLLASSVTLREGIEEMTKQ